MLRGCARFCREFFPWYNNEHYHTGIGLLTPTSLHYGEAQKILQRTATLDAAYERIQNDSSKADLPRRLTAAVWINPPAERQPNEKKKPPEINCPQRPDASLTHPRSGYPSASCSSAALASVSPDNLSKIRFPQPLSSRAMPQKTSGVWGLAPKEAEKVSNMPTTLH